MEDSLSINWQNMTHIHCINFDIIAMVKGNCILVSHRTSKIRRIALKIAKAKTNYNNFYGHSKIIAA